jgi:hypothetical protein
MGKHGEALQNFQSLFPHTFREKPELFSRYADVNNLICGYLDGKLHKKPVEASVFDLAGPDGKISRGLTDYLSERYKKEGTRSPYASTANMLLELELGYITSQGFTTPEMAQSGFFNPETLSSLMKEMWLGLARKGGRGLQHSRDGDVEGDPRASLPLVRYGNEVFASMLEVSERFKVTDAKSLLVDRADYILLGIRRRLQQPHWTNAFKLVACLRKKI